MTIQFPDVSQYTPVSLAGAPVAIARATISNVKDTRYGAFVADATAHGVPLLAYCFLNAGSLGVSPEAQADFAFSVVGTRPTMLDHEPNRGACASLAESCRWIDRFRSHGGVVHLDYLPRWSWSGSMGSPGLGPLADRGMALVASNYTTYSDSGPGWTPYYAGCPVPVVQWQYSSTHVFNGVGCDWNAFRGTVQQYLELAGGQDVDLNYNQPVPPGPAQAGNPGRTLGQLIGDLWAQTFGVPNRIAGLAAQLDALAAPQAVTQEQVDAAILKVLSDPTVVDALVDKIAGRLAEELATRLGNG